MAQVTGGKSKKPYVMTVGDKGRSFRDPDTGREMDERTFRAEETDWTESAGNTAFGNKDRSGVSRADSSAQSGMVHTRPADAPVIREEDEDGAGSLGALAAKRKKKPSASDQGAALKGTPTPRPTPKY